MLKLCGIDGGIRHTLCYVLRSGRCLVPNKIELMLCRMKQLEGETYCLGDPVLLHSDLKVTDENLNVIADSFWKYQKLNPEAKQLNKLLLQNNVTGCAVMLNRSLIERAIPVPEAAIMHVYWLALVAAAFGKVEYMETPLVLYRQHGDTISELNGFSCPIF